MSITNFWWPSMSFPMALGQQALQGRHLLHLNTQLVHGGAQDGLVQPGGALHSRGGALACGLKLHQNRLAGR